MMKQMTIHENPILIRICKTDTEKQNKTQNTFYVDQINEVTKKQLPKAFEGNLAKL